MAPKRGWKNYGTDEFEKDKEIQRLENDAHCCAHEAEQALEQECEPESLQQETR
jgi:hypothetical protein